MAQDRAQRIAGKIRDGTKKQVEKIISEAMVRANEIKQRAEMAAKEKKKQIVEKGQIQCKLEEQRIIAEAKIKARQLKLNAQEELLNEAFKRAEEQLKKIVEKPEYKSHLQHLIEEAVSSIGSRDLEIVCGERERAVLKQNNFLDALSKAISSKMNAPVNLDISSETANKIGGVIVRTKDRRIEVDNTFEARMQRLKDSLRTKVAHILFSKEIA
ncbi:MAG: V-type ATP synthase subunit E family protein [Euryarchaeota archaeon]|nr:V-type ATP synthase subunit E family protein [Euryarchaeota archaeon]